MADPGSTSSSSDPHLDYAEVVLMSHGETVSGSTHIMQGQLNVELNDVGRAQATRVAEKLSKERKVSAVYSSNLRRAYDTAKIIALQCGLRRIFMDPDLAERHFGILQGLVPFDAVVMYPKAYIAKLDGERIQEGGESIAQLSKRFTAALKRIRMHHLGERVVVVTHENVIKSVFKGVGEDSPSTSRCILNKRFIVFHLYEHKWVILNN